MRWRFSAFSATVAPVRSASVRELSTGVSRITPAPAAAARATSPALSAAASGASGSAHPPSATTASISTCAPRGSAATPTATPGRRARLEERRVDLVDRRERGHVGHVDRHLDRVAEAGAGRLADRGEVLQASARLVGGGAADQVAGARVERDLTRAEQQAAGVDCVDVGPDGRRGVGGGHRLAMVAKPSPSYVRSTARKPIARLPAGVASYACPTASPHETSPYLLPAQGQSGRLVPWGEEALRRAPATRSGRCWSRSATRPATGAT